MSKMNFVGIVSIVSIMSKNMSMNLRIILRIISNSTFILLVIIVEILGILILEILKFELKNGNLEFGI